MAHKLLYFGKHVLISGGSSGLGRNLTINYAKKGATIINISRDSNKMEELNESLYNINGNENLFYSVDVSKYEDIKRVKDNLAKKSISPDIIINNAAGNFLCPFERLSENGWKRVIDIVLNGNFNITHIFGRELIKKKKPGVFLNITTTYASTGSALVAPSASAKAATDALMKSLTVEWAPHNIRFVGIAPGPIADTGGVVKLDPFKIFKYYNDYTNPSNRMCNPDEIAELAIFLTSPSADYINGEIITIDGGESIKNGGQFNFVTNIPFYQRLLGNK